MKWATYRTAGAAPVVGLLRGDELHAVAGNRPLTELIGMGADLLDELAAATLARPASVVSVDEVTFLPPVDPPSVRDAMCFHDHIRNGFGQQEIDERHHRYPTFYFSNPAAVVGADDDVAMTPGSERFDYELEVAVVIGEPGFNIAPADAHRHIAGYTIFCDWSARDVQVDEMALKLGPAKGKDTAITLGPVLVTPDELAPFAAGKGFDREMEAFVNGVRTSVGNWSSIDWSVEDVIAYTGRGTLLRSGDVIGLGTVGSGSLGEQRVQDPEGFRGFLREGDVVEMCVEGLGSTSNTLVAPVPVHRLSSGH